MKTDAEILDWLEKWHTLHYTVEALYVVDGYEASIYHDGNLVEGPCRGMTLREAYSVLMNSRPE